MKMKYLKLIKITKDNKYIFEESNLVMYLLTAFNFLDVIIGNKPTIIIRCNSIYKHQFDKLK